MTLTRFAAGFLLAMTVLLAGIGSGGATPAFAHGGAKVTVSPTAGTAGGAIDVSVAGYEASTLVRITLEGVAGSIPVGTLTASSDGTGRASFTLSNALSPGSYTLRANGGDDNVTTDLSITAGASGQAPASQQATIDYKQPFAQVVGIALAILIVALTGVTLVWRSRDRGTAASR